VYDRSGEVVVTDPVLGRRLRIATEGAANTVVWNPWVAKAAAMPTSATTSGHRCCASRRETSGNAVTLEPGASATLRTGSASKRRKRFHMFL
jgi:glucose-6-phosphate 1-epimerase